MKKSKLRTQTGGRAPWNWTHRRAPWNFSVRMAARDSVSPPPSSRYSLHRCQRWLPSSGLLAPCCLSSGADSEDSEGSVDRGALALCSSTSQPANMLLVTVVVGSSSSDFSSSTTGCKNQRIVDADGWRRTCLHPAHSPGDD